MTQPPLTADELPADEFAKHVADVFELVIHDLQAERISIIPQPHAGLSDHGIIRLNLDDLGRLVVRIINGEYDPVEVRQRNRAHRVRRDRQAKRGKRS